MIFYDFGPNICGVLHSLGSFLIPRIVLILLSISPFRSLLELIMFMNAFRCRVLFQKFSANLTLLTNLTLIFI